MILIDATWLLYKCNYRLSDLVTRTGRPTGMEYGFIKSIEALKKYFDDEVVLCWEGKNNFRYKIDPDYKLPRQLKRQKDSHSQLTLSRVEEFKTILSMIAENAQDDELEADDVIASLADIYCQKENVIIYSGDKDLHQLLREKPFPVEQVKVYRFRHKPWTEMRIQLEFEGLMPRQLPTYFAFAGDTVDNIKGVSRTRKTYIAAAIRDGYSPQRLGDYPLFSSRELFALEEFYNSGQFDKNLQLVTLRRKDIEVQPRDWNAVAIKRWLVKMEFQTLKLCQQCGGIDRIVLEGDEF